MGYFVELPIPAHTHTYQEESRFETMLLFEEVPYFSLGKHVENEKVLRPIELITLPSIDGD